MNHAEIIKGLADETRLRIMGLMALVNCELCVCQIVEALGESQYKISRHLRILKTSGWLKERRDGRWIHYSLAGGYQDPFRAGIIIALLKLPPSFLELKRSITEIKMFSKKNPCEVSR